MRRREVGVEGGGIVVDLVEDDPVARPALGREHVEQAAARLVAQGGGGVLEHEAAELGLLARMQLELDQDDEAAVHSRQLLEMDRLAGRSRAIGGLDERRRS